MNLTTVLVQSLWTGDKKDEISVRCLKKVLTLVPVSKLNTAGELVGNATFCFTTLRRSECTFVLLASLSMNPSGSKISFSRDRLLSNQSVLAFRMTFPLSARSSDNRSNRNVITLIRRGRVGRSFNVVCFWCGNRRVGMFLRA